MFNQCFLLLNLRFLLRLTWVKPWMYNVGYSWNDQGCVIMSLWLLDHKCTRVILLNFMFSQCPSKGLMKKVWLKNILIIRSTVLHKPCGEIWCKKHHFGFWCLCIIFTKPTRSKAFWLYLDRVFFLWLKQLISLVYTSAFHGFFNK